MAASESTQRVPCSLGPTATAQHHASEVQLMLAAAATHVGDNCVSCDMTYITRVVTIVTHCQAMACIVELYKKIGIHCVLQSSMLANKGNWEYVPMTAQPGCVAVIVAVASRQYQCMHVWP